MNNPHADDIDFQIESDFAGMMSPGMINTASEICDRTGHIMNYGDGWYGGVFMAAMYATAFISDDIDVIVSEGLKPVPEKSRFYGAISDVIKWHRQYPDDWKQSWFEFEKKHTSEKGCPEGVFNAFNIDAGVNAAYVVMGLLYGEKDFYKTMDIATRCGQDSDCNPSNAMSVLGVIKGFSNLPAEMKKGISDIGDSLFINTNYSFNKAVESTYAYATDFVKKDGGEVSGRQIRIKIQHPQAPPLEISFPDVVFDHRVSIFEPSAWQMKGNWQTYKVIPWQQKKLEPQAMFSGKAGDELVLKFNGTGITLMGNWIRDGGKADIYLDGRLSRTIDSYFYWNKQEHQGMNLWHVMGLNPGDHELRVVVRGDKRPESAGTNLYVTEALIFKTAPKENENFRFTFAL
jgi:hypothetical protein